MTANTPVEISDVIFLKQTKMSNMAHASTKKLTDQHMCHILYLIIQTRHSFQLAYKVPLRVLQRHDKSTVDMNNEEQNIAFVRIKATFLVSTTEKTCREKKNREETT